MPFSFAAFAIDIVEFAAVCFPDVDVGLVDEAKAAVEGEKEDEEEEGDGDGKGGVSDKAVADMRKQMEERLETYIYILV